ncbi:MAG TPA: proline dehydrogenase family protein [Actinomycetota bacterium]
MEIARDTLLWASENDRLRALVPHLPFVQRAVRRFMPGERLDDGVDAARRLQDRGLPTTFTHLGENVHQKEEAEAATQGYLDALDRIAEAGLDAEVSVKLTHLGLDLDPGLAAANVERLVERASPTGRWVWIDMEASAFVERTVEVYRRVLEQAPLVGLCLQAYLHRTPRDLEELLPLGPSIRLVKGAYREPEEVALATRAEHDVAFFSLSETLLGGLKAGKVRRFAAATHDLALLGKVASASRSIGLPPTAWETQMLYGIRQGDQFRLLERGYPVRTLVSYGPAWYPWYVRRLAEKPSNVWFVVRNVFARDASDAGA